MATLTKGMKNSLKYVVKQCVFPSVKVIAGPWELDYGERIEKMVWEHWCGHQAANNQSLNKEDKEKRKAFWSEETKSIVRREINNKRNNVSGVLRQKFLGE